MSRKRAADLPQQILSETVRLVGERGFGALALQDVADAVGTTKQALLYHFASREALKLAVIDHLVSVANRLLIDLMGTLGGDEAQRIDQIIKRVERLFEAEPDAARAVLRFLLDGEPAARTRIAEGTRPWLKFMTDLIRRGQKDGAVRPELDPEAAVVQVGVLVLSNIALLDVHGWTERSPRQWRAARLGELCRDIRFIVYADNARASAKA